MPILSSSNNFENIISSLSKIEEANTAYLNNASSTNSQGNYVPAPLGKAQDASKI